MPLPASSWLVLAATLYTIHLFVSWYYNAFSSYERVLDLHDLRVLAPSALVFFI